MFEKYEMLNADLKHDMSVLSQSRALHGEGCRGSRIPRLKMSILKLSHVASLLRGNGC